MKFYIVLLFTSYIAFASESELITPVTRSSKADEAKRKELLEQQLLAIFYNPDIKQALSQLEHLQQIPESNPDSGLLDELLHELLKKFPYNEIYEDLVNNKAQR